MTDQTEYCMVITTCPSMEEAEKIIEALLKKNLAACIQITNIESYYKWKGEINLDQEKLLLIKTKANLYKKVEQTIKILHPYEVPEIIQIPIVRGAEEYLNWVDEVTGAEGSK